MFYWTLTRSFLSFYFGQSVALWSKNTPDVTLCTPLCSGSRTDKRTHVLYTTNKIYIILEILRRRGPSPLNWRNCKAVVCLRCTTRPTLSMETFRNFPGIFPEFFRKVSDIFLLRKSYNPSYCVPPVRRSLGATLRMKMNSLLELRIFIASM